MQFDSPTVSSEIIDALKRWPELNTSSWSLTCALTLALKPNVYSDGFLFPLDELQAKQNFRIFMKSLNRACYGSHGGRRHGLKLKVIPVLERELEGRLHYHAGASQALDPCGLRAGGQEMLVQHKLGRLPARRHPHQVRSRHKLGTNFHAQAEAKIRPGKMD
jgi:hypothetical protein